MVERVDFIDAVSSLWIRNADQEGSRVPLFLLKWRVLVKATIMYLYLVHFTVREPVMNDFVSTKRSHRYLYILPYESNLKERV